MIICKNCGSRNDDDDAFCGECDEPLEWEGERVAPTPKLAAAPLPARPTPESGPGLVTRIKAAVGIGSGESTERTEQAAPPAEVAPTAPTAFRATPCRYLRHSTVASRTNTTSIKELITTLSACHRNQ